MNKTQKSLPFLIFFSIAIGVLLGVLLNFPLPERTTSKNAHKNKLNKLIAFIDNEYVDDVNTDSIVDLTCNNILEKLDPHSVYIPKNEQDDIAMSMKGNFVGVGVNFESYPPTPFAALRTARTLAVATSSSIPTPQMVLPLAVLHST